MFIKFCNRISIKIYMFDYFYDYFFILYFRSFIISYVFRSLQNTDSRLEDGFSEFYSTSVTIIKRMI